MKPPEVIVLVFLIYAALIDVRLREIDPVVTALTALTGVVFIWLERRQDPLGILLGLIPGIVLVLFAFASRGAFGVGDGLTITTIGLFIAIKPVVITLAAALVFSACFAAGVLVRESFAARRSKTAVFAGRKTLPFLPFVLAGFVVDLLIQLE